MSEIIFVAAAFQQSMCKNQSFFLFLSVEGHTFVGDNDPFHKIHAI